MAKYENRRLKAGSRPNRAELCAIKTYSWPMQRGINRVVSVTDVSPLASWTCEKRLAWIRMQALSMFVGGANLAPVWRFDRVDSLQTR